MLSAREAWAAMLSADQELLSARAEGDAEALARARARSQAAHDAFIEALFLAELGARAW